ncbi:MAG: gliding motility-associated C-terminal domain-containing protein [Bacteroidetes bacterium]|nr:gliding motility-associated C-terminal domain-containing protein [Bacteroidota bacterium]
MFVIINMKLKAIKFYKWLNNKTVCLFILSFLFFSALDAQNTTSTCSGSPISYNPYSGETYTWTVTAITGTVTGAVVGQPASSGTIINPTLVNSSSSSATVTYNVTTLSHPSFTLIVTVNPIPAMNSSLTAPAICSGSKFNYNPSSTVTGTTLAWTRSINSDINTPPSSGNNNPNETLTSTSSIPVSVNYIYRLTAAGCTNQQIVSVIVNPTPTLTSTVTSPICSGSVFNFNPLSGTPNTSFNWSRALVTSISNPAASASGDPKETLVNTSSNTIPVTYVYSLAANSCSNTQNIVVLVNPTANITNSNSFTSQICSGVPQGYSSLTDIPGTNIAWTRTVVTGISNTAAAGNTSVTEALDNTTTSPITVTYNFTLTTSSQCVSKEAINITVNPIPHLTSTLTPPAICSGTPFSYNPTSLTAGSVFFWTRAVQPSISNGAGNNIGNPLEILVNTSNTIITVAYIFNTTANGCSNPEIVNVPIKPTPAVSSPQLASACNNGSFTINPSGVPTGTQYTWTSPTIAPAGAITGSSTGTLQNFINQTLSNNTGSNATATYTITPWTAGCVGASFQGVVTVSPVGFGTVIPDIITTACNNSNFSVSPPSAPSGTNYIWSSPSYTPSNTISGGVSQVSPSSNIFGLLVNSSSSPAVATYSVTPIAGTCSGSIFTVSVTVDNPAVLSSSVTPPAVCSNALFSYVPTSITANTSFTWSRVSMSNITNIAQTGVNNPNEMLNNTSTNPVKVDYLYTLTTGICTNQQIVTVFVNPLPKLSSATPNPICSGTTFNYLPTSSTSGATYVWTRPVITNITNTSTSATSNPNEVLVNTSINPVNVPYNFTLTANGCNNSETVNVLVNPTPVVSNQITSSCNNTTFSFTPQNVPVGTKYTWTAPTANPLLSLSGGTAQSVLQNTIGGTLTNLTLNPATATYIVTPNTNGCFGSTFTLSVDVTATTNLSSSLTPPDICSNTVFNYVPASNTFGTAFGWTRSNIFGISNIASSGAGNPNEVLVNNTNAVVAVPYLFTLSTPGGCINLQTVTINVKPSPVLSSNLIATAICTGTLFNYTPTSISTSPTFSWSRPFVPGISNAASSGSGLFYPNEILVNTSTLPVTVPYSFTTTSNSCSYNETVTVVVNPKPSIGNQGTTICSNTSFNVIPSSAITGTQYKWSLPSLAPINSVSGSFAQPILQDSISQLLKNLTINDAKVSYNITPIAYGCQGSNFTLDVIVKPIPVIANQLISDVCSGIAFNYAAPSASIPNATVYTWSNPIIGPANSLIGGSEQPIYQNSVSQILSSSNNLFDTATYTVVPSSAGCAGATFTLTVPIKPVPIINNIFDTVCTGFAFNVIPSPAPLNTTYTWTVPTSIPFGKIIGGSANSTALNAISQVLVNTGSIPAQMMYSITPSANGCKGNAFTLLETVGVPLLTIPNVGATICSGTSFDVTPLTVPANTKYTWMIQSITPAGMITGRVPQIIPQSKITDTLTNLSSSMATAVYLVTPSNTGCFGSNFLATINVRVAPRATLTGKPIICAYAKDTLSVSFLGVGPWSFDYLDNGIAKQEIGINSNPYTWIVPTPLLATGKTIAITKVYDQFCVDSVDITQFSQKVNPLPIGNLVSLHGNYICNNTTDTMFVSYSALDTLKIQWSFNGNLIPGINSDSITTLTPGRYNALFTNQFGCTDSSALPINLMYIQQPVLKFNLDSYCINKQMNFTNLTDTSFIGSISWLWDMGDSTTRNSFNASAIYSHAGKLHIRLTATQLYCQSYKTTIDSTFNIEHPIPGIRMPSMSAYISQPLPITVRSIPTYRYRWVPSRGIDFPDSSSVNFNYQITQDYLINLISPGGCISNDSVLVRVFDDNLVDIFVPKSFSPNGDGVNDKLYPYLTGVKTFQYFKVFNRFGKLMFESRNHDEGWDGTVGGTQQPMAIYIWVAVGIGLDGNPVERKLR